MKIVNYNWDPRSSAETRKKVLDGLMPFIEQNMMYERILRKEMQKMTLHSDVVRFLRQDAIIIKKGSETVGFLFILFYSSFLHFSKCPFLFQIYHYSGPNDDVREAEKILVTLAQQLNDQVSLKALKDHFSSTVRGGSGLSEQLKSFFSADSSHFTDSLPLITLLKGISSDMYFPAYLKLRSAFFSVFPFKDVKGSGRLVITFSTPEEIVKGAPIWQVVHIKREQTTSETASQYFEFDWQLTLGLTNLEHKTMETSVGIVEYAFGDHTTHDIKIDTVAAWSPFLIDSLKSRNPLLLMSGKKTLTGRSRKKFLESQKSQDLAN